MSLGVHVAASGAWPGSVLTVEQNIGGSTSLTKEFERIWLPAGVGNWGNIRGSRGEGRKREVLKRPCRNARRVVVDM